MKDQIYTGKDLVDLLDELQVGNIKWLLPRSSIRNLATKISGLLITGYFSNNVLGIALSKNYNFLLIQEELSISDFSLKYIPQKLTDVLDIMYKNDIFVIVLQQNWIFRSSTGNQMLADIFGKTKFLISTLSIPGLNLVVQLSKYTTLTGILQRFKNPIPLNFEYSSSLEITSLVVIPNLLMTDLEEIARESIDLVITTDIKSSAIILAERLEIKVIWLSIKDILNEIARDLYYLIKRYARLDTEFIQ